MLRLVQIIRYQKFMKIHAKFQVYIEILNTISHFVMTHLDHTLVDPLDDAFMDVFFELDFKFDSSDEFSTSSTVQSSPILPEEATMTGNMCGIEN